MKGNFQVRFLEGWPPAMGAGYSAEMVARGTTFPPTGLLDRNDFRFARLHQESGRAVVLSVIA
jgi:hypothetical protein